MMSGVASLLIAVFVLVSSLRLGVGALPGPGPGFVLFWSAVGLALLSFALLGPAFFGKEEADRPPDSMKRAERRNAAIVVAVLIVYCGLLPKLGYCVSTFLLMAVLFGLGRMKPWLIALSSLSAVLLSYYLFAQLLRTPLPRGVWGF
ncbi:MAG: tripartite tricarboxylate transporter TctB family protein [Deltaproteobacteria bacterium]|nr:tripartite tricarboxylate transporter TctB family protein [Deltaproteobacteria bacterium]